MGQEILYCHQCQRRIVGAEFAKGQAYQVGDTTSCSSCAAELLPTLPSKEREQLLAQMFKATRDRHGGSSAALKATPPSSSSRKRTTARIPIIRPRSAPSEGSPGPAVWWGLGGTALVIVLVVLAILGGGKGAPEPAPSRELVRRAPPPAPSEESSLEARRRDSALAALRKARDYSKDHPEDLEGQIRAWEEAVLSSEQTAVFEDAKRELAQRVGQRAAIAKGLMELEDQARPHLAAEQYKSASDLFQGVRGRYEATEWTGPIDRRVREIHDLAVQAGASLRDKAMAAQERRATDEVRETLERISRFGYPDVEVDIRRAVESVVPPAAPDPPRETGPISRWALDEGKGATCTDASGRFHAMHRGNVGWTPGRSGSALRLDGKGAYLELPNVPELDQLQSGSYSVSLWYKPDALPADPNEKAWGGAEALLMKGPFREGLCYIAGGRFVMIHWLAGGKWTSAGSWTEAFGPGAWHHVVGVVDRAAGENRIYVNGVQKGQESWPKDSPSQDFWSEHWKIGMVNFDKKDQYLARGSFSDLRFYDRTVNAAEVGALFAAGPGQSRPPSPESQEPPKAGQLPAPRK